MAAFSTVPTALAAENGGVCEPTIPFVKGSLDWRRGIENQRIADKGNGTYLNPIMAGDHPDPTVMKDGDDYYMTFSSFDSQPGLLIWHSKDLVSWEPVAPALQKNVGSVWAPDLLKYNGKYYLYFPGRTADKQTIFVVTADDIHGPWSDPIDLNIPRIDPGHIVGEDGKRYLYLSGGDYVQLADDGLSAAGDIKHVYDGWDFPADWVVESFAQEGPKMVKHGLYYYMILAEGGTAGPPTGHMVLMARSKSILGPWENSPYNPIIRTKSPEEKWWSRGHASVVQGPDKKWYMVYHGYEKGFYTLGRQLLMEPVEWTTDGWLKSKGFDIGRAIPKPAGGKSVPHGMAFSDDFSKSKFGVQWSFYKGGDDDAKRVRYENGALILKGKGKSPADSSPLTFPVGDQAYRVEVEMELVGNATAGLVLFYNSKLYAGLGFHENGIFMHRYGNDRPYPAPEALRTGACQMGCASSGAAAKFSHMWLRLTNDRQIMTINYSYDGQTWKKFGTQMEVSGYNHNTAYDFLSLRPGIYAAGDGEVIFRNFKYEALP